MFFKEPGDNFFKRFSPRIFYSTVHINFFNFSKFICSIYFMVVFKGPGEKLFWKIMNNGLWKAITNGLYKGMNNSLWKAITNGLCKGMNNGFGIIRTDIFHSTNLLYWYQEMGGTLSHRSESFSARMFYYHKRNLRFLFDSSLKRKDLERNFLKGFSSRIFGSLHIIFFSTFQ